MALWAKYGHERPDYKVYVKRMTDREKADKKTEKKEIKRREKNDKELEKQDKELEKQDKKIKIENLKPND